MRRIYQLITWIAFALTILPSFLYLAGRLDLDRVKLMMLIATIVWFVATPLWMGRKTGQTEPE